MLAISLPNPLRWAFIAAVVLLALDDARLRVQAAQLRAEHAEYVTEATTKELKASQDARLAEQKHAREIDEIVAAHRKEEADAAKHAELVIAGVRSGAVSLRKSLSCPTPGESAAAAAAGGGDAGEARGFTRADAEAALGIAADGDSAIRQLHACQAVIEAQQRTCNGATSDEGMVNR